MAYTKLFSSIVTSTIWTEDDKTRIVWITMLALANKNGEVQGSIPGLARIAAVPVDCCRVAIQKFLSPDPDSRTKDDEGRRIEEIDGGWYLLNHQKYREMASKEESREAEAKRKARYRAKLARNKTEDMSQGVPDMSQEVPESRHIAEAQAEAPPLKNSPLPPKGDGFVVNGITPQQRRLSPTKQKSARVNANTSEMNLVGSILGRRPSTIWTVAEALQLESVRPSAEAIELLQRYYNVEMPKADDYRRRSLETLLNHWNGEIDKANLYFIDNP